MQRTQVNSDRKIQQLSPSANPVDTYARPQVAPIERQADRVGYTPNLGGQQLAQALGGLSKTLGNYAVQQQYVTSEADKAQAKADAETWAQKSRVSFNELAKNDPKLRGRSPWLKYYYENSVMENLGNEFNLKLNQDWETSPLRESQDINAYSTLYQQSLKQFTEDNLTNQGFDTANVTAFYDKARAAQQSIAKRHLDYVTKRNVERAKEASGIATSTELTTLNKGITLYQTEQTSEALKQIKAIELKNPQNPGKVQAEKIRIQGETVKKAEAYKKEQIKALGASLTEKGKLAVLNNMNGTDWNEATANSILAEMSAVNNLSEIDSLTDLLKEVKTGTGSLHDIAWVKLKSNEIKLKVAERLDRQDLANERESKKAKDSEIQRLRAAAQEMILDNPRANVSDLVDAVTGLDAGQGVQLQNFVDARRTRVNADVERAADREIYLSPPDTPIPTGTLNKASPGALRYRGIQEAINSGKQESTTIRDRQKELFAIQSQYKGTILKTTAPFFDMDKEGLKKQADSVSGYLNTHQLPTSEKLGKMSPQEYQAFLTKFTAQSKEYVQGLSKSGQAQPSGSYNREQFSGGTPKPQPKAQPQGQKQPNKALQGMSREQKLRMLADIQARIAALEAKRGGKK